MSDQGAAILNFGDVFGPNAVRKAMSNDGPNLSANNLSANKVTPYEKIGNISSDDHIEVMGGSPTPGYAGTKAYGQNDSSADAN